MSTLKANSEQKKNNPDISKDDFESPVVFKKFKPSNNSSHTNPIKRRKPKGKRQLTLDQVYNENFRYSDMNSEHLQLALALSRSTSEMFNDHNDPKEENGKKRTLLEFGFKINKPKLNVGNKIFNRELPKNNKKSKFRFITPILMMRTDEERESLIQSKLSSIFGQNTIHPMLNKSSIPDISSKDLEKIRCRCCSLFNLNRKGNSLKEDFLLPQLNIERTRARIDVLLKDWKKIALRDHSPSRSNMESSRFSGTDSRIECYKDSSEILTSENNTEKQQSTNSDSNILSDTNFSSQEITRYEEKLEHNESPINNGLSVDYVYEAVSPDLFDNDFLLSIDHTPTKNKLNNIVTETDVVYEHHTTNSIDSNISLKDKFILDQEYELNAEENMCLEKGNASYFKDVYPQRNESEKKNTKHDINISDEITCESVNGDKTLLMNVSENMETSIISNSKDEGLKKISKSKTPPLLLNEHTVNITSDEKGFCELGTKSLQPLLEEKECWVRASSTLSDCGSEYGRISLEDFQKSKNDSYEHCIEPRSNKEISNIFSTSSENLLPVKSYGQINLSVDYQVSKSMSPVSYNDEIGHSLESGNIIMTNSESLNEIIVSSDEEYSISGKNDYLSDLLEIEELNEKYSKKRNCSSVETSNNEQFSISRSIDLGIQNLFKNRLSDSPNYSEFTKDTDLNVLTENYHTKTPILSNDTFRNEFVDGIILSSDNEIYDVEICEKKYDNLELGNAKLKPGNSNISTIDNSPVMSISSNSSQKSYIKKYDSFDVLKLNSKDFSNEQEKNNSLTNLTKELELTNKIKSSIHISKTSRFSNILSDSILNDVFEKHSSFIKKDCCESETFESRNSLEIESKACNVSWESDDELKFSNNKPTQNRSNKQKQTNMSNSSPSYNSLSNNEDSNEVVEIKGKRKFDHPIQNDLFDMTFRNIEEMSYDNLVNIPDQTLKKDCNTPLRRCTSFNENEMSIKNINFVRHKSESDITPNNKIIIKTENITPMLNYNTFSTPDIVKELNKFGLKPLKRKRGINLLKHIYESTHPILESHQKNMEEIPAVKRRRSHMDNDSQNIKSNRKMKEAQVLKGWSETIFESEAIFERPRSSKIYSCPVPLQIVWHNFLNENPNIFQNILLYEPLQVEVIHRMLKEVGYKFHIQDLITFFDQRCITIRVAQGNHGKVG